MLELVITPQSFDAVIIGSGATGGWAAKKLAQAGMQVALLEAGETTSATDFTGCDTVAEDTIPANASELDSERPIQAWCYACKSPKSRWFVNDFDNPYRQIKPYRWIRMRVLGGRLLAWERQSYRMSDLDFKAASHDGYGDDWPISYRDLLPYYEEVERYLQITGRRENLAHLPDSVFVRHAKDNVTLKALGSMGARLNRVVTPARLAVMTRERDDNQTCYYCGPADDGQFAPSFFSTPWRALNDAARTGRLRLITNAIASHISVKDGKASGVTYVDRTTKKWREIRGKVVVLCASTLESTRILLNSGICNESGTLGRYLMDHIYGSAWGTLEGTVTEPLIDSHQRHRVYIPRFRNVTQQETNGFLRGYGLQGRSIFDTDLAEKVRQGGVKEAQWTVRLSSFGECLPREDNGVEVEPERVDAWGIPVLRIKAAWSGNELRLWRDATMQAAEMLQAAGAREIGIAERPSIPGLAIHETGTARMGDNPKTSVVNRYCQAHEVSNIFVTDGACWVSSGCQNPTLTMMALTVRTCDFITTEYSKKKA